MQTTLQSSLFRRITPLMLPMLLCGLAGCGQKGPLQLPAAAPAASSTAR